MKKQLSICLAAALLTGLLMRCAPADPPAASAEAPTAAPAQTATPTPQAEETAAAQAQSAAPAQETEGDPVVYMTADISPEGLQAVYAALGGAMLAVRLISCFLCGVAAGALVRALCRRGSFFNFRGFAEHENRDTDPNPLRRYGKNLWRNVRATAGFFFLGVLLSAAFQRYVPAETMTALFGGNEALGVLMAATVGVPLYACGGGTIPLLQQWLLDGMRPGSAAAFLLTGPSTKITNLGALKIVLGWKHFLLYLAFVMGFSLAAGLVVNAIL